MLKHFFVITEEAEEHSKVYIVFGKKKKEYTAVKTAAVKRRQKGFTAVPKNKNKKTYKTLYNRSSHMKRHTMGKTCEPQKEKKIDPQSEVMPF